METARKHSASRQAAAQRSLLDLDRYVPFFFTAISNKLSRGASRIYRKRFGVGVIDWRVLSQLAIEPGITGNRICQVIGLDKAAVSRSLRLLERKGLVSAAADPRDTRRRSISLTPAGYELHDRIIVVALERERRLLEVLTATETETLRSLLRRLQGRLATMDGDAGMRADGLGKARSD